MLDIQLRRAAIVCMLACVALSPSRLLARPEAPSAAQRASASPRAATTPPTKPLPRAGNAVDFQSVPLGDVLDYLRDAAGVNLYINWPALELAGVSRNQPITLNLRSVSVGKLLDLTLAQCAAPGSAPLAWYVSDGVVHVTTAELADREMITRIYSVHDLIADVPDFQAPTLSLSSNASSSGGSGNNIFSGSGTDAPGSQQMTREQRGEKLVATIVAVVRPEIWQANGGSASIRFYNGQLIITAPRSIHALL